VTVVSVLPGAVPAMRRADGSVLVALQTATSSGDPSRDVAAALLAALALQTGAAVSLPGLPEPGPRLQDLLDPDAPFDVTVHDTFDFWVGEAADDPSTAALLEQANASIIPTQRLASVPSAYVATMGDRRYLRWVQPHPEGALHDALARLRAAGEDALGEHTTMLGMFRAHGVLIPVWELDDDVLLDDLEPYLVEQTVPAVIDGVLPMIRTEVVPALLDDIVDDPRVRDLIREQSQGMVIDAVERVRSTLARGDDVVEAVGLELAQQLLHAR